MKIKEEIKKEIETLIILGDKLHISAIYVFYSQSDLDQVNEEHRKTLEQIGKEISFKSKYHEWYAKSLNYVATFLPSRKNDFIDLYRKKDAEKRKEISPLNYGIQDAIHGLSKSFNGVAPSFGVTLFEQQLAILKSLIGTYESAINSLTFELQEQLLDDEISSARKLIKVNLRAAGALAGVILERHLKMVCQNHSLNVGKKNPTINDYNDLLKANSIIELPVYRHIQLLGDLRNLCDHSKKIDPKLDDINLLIDGTEKIIKTVF